MLTYYITVCIFALPYISMERRLLSVSFLCFSYLTRSDFPRSLSTLCVVYLAKILPDSDLLGVKAREGLVAELS